MNWPRSHNLTSLVDVLMVEAEYLNTWRAAVVRETGVTRVVLKRRCFGAELYPYLFKPANKNSRAARIDSNLELLVFVLSYGLAHNSEANRLAWKSCAGGDNHEYETAYVMLERFRTDRARLMRQWLAKEWERQHRARRNKSHRAGRSAKQRLITLDRQIAVQRRLMAECDLTRKKHAKLVCALRRREGAIRRYIALNAVQATPK